MGIINQFRKQIATHRGDEWSIKIFNCSQNLNECSLARAPQISMPLAKKAIAPLTTGASSGLASLGVDKIFGKGQRGGFLIPMDKIAHLVAYKHLLNTGQKKDILKVPVIQHLFMFPIQLMARECIIRIPTCHHLSSDHGKTPLVRE